MRVTKALASVFDSTQFRDGNVEFSDADRDAQIAVPELTTTSTEDRPDTTSMPVLDLDWSTLDLGAALEEGHEEQQHNTATACTLGYDSVLEGGQTEIGRDLVAEADDSALDGKHGAEKYTRA